LLHSDDDKRRTPTAIDCRRATLRCLMLLCGLFIVLAAGGASASEGALVVAEFQGAKPIGVRERVVELLRGDGYALVDDMDIPMVHPDEGDDHFVRLARDGGYRGFVLGYTSMKSNGWTTSITVRDGRTGAVLGKTSIGAGWYPGLLKALDKKLLDRIGGFLDKAEAPEQSASAKPESDPEPEPEETREDPPMSHDEKWDEDGAFADEEDDDASGSVDDDDVQDALSRHRGKDKRHDPALIVDGGALFVQRQWSLVDPVAGPGDGPILASHDVPMFGIQAAVALYPVAFFSKSFLRHLGVTVGYQRSYKARTTLPATPDKERATLFEELDIGGRIRIPISDMTLGLVAGGGAQALSVAGVNAANPHPDPVYQYWYAGLDYGLPLTPSLSLEAALLYRGVTTTGEEYGQIQAPEWFPDTTGSGFGGNLDGIFMFNKWVGARLGTHFMRYALDFNPNLERLQEAADAGEPAPPIVGGATDLYWGLDLSLVITVE